VVGICPHEPNIRRNSYFLIQPFDKEKKDREEAIENALRKFYGRNNYEIKKSDSGIYDFSSYCDICLKIKSSEYCIVDISGEIHKVVDEKSGEIKSKIFLRPNVALELGMAYGFNKPAMILSRTRDGMREIPTDIEFVRYIDITPVEIQGWPGASQKILDRLRARATIRPITESINIDCNVEKKIVKKHYEKMLQLKRTHSKIKNKTFEICQIIYRQGDLIGIIRNASELIDDLYFNFYTLDGEIEMLKAIVKVHHVQENGLVQVKFYPKDYEGTYYLKYVIQNCLENNSFIPDQHRLELIISEDLNKITSEEIRFIIDMIDRTCRI